MLARWQEAAGACTAEDYNILPLPTTGTGIVGAGNLADINPLAGVSDFGPSCATPGAGATGPCLYPATMTRRNAFAGPGFWNFTLGTYKDLKLTEKFHMQLRAEAFNIFNHHNF